MIRKLVQIGNSLGVLVPKQILDVLGWNRYTFVKYTAQGDTLTIRPAPTKDDYIDLLFQGQEHVNEENLIGS